MVSAIDKVALPDSEAYECQGEVKIMDSDQEKQARARTRKMRREFTTSVMIQSFAIECPAHHEDVIVFGYFAAVSKQFQQIKELPVNVTAHGRGRIHRLHVGLFQQNLLDL